MGYYFQLAARVLLYAPSYRQDSTYHDLCYTSRGALVGMRDQSNTPSHHEQTLYHGVTSCSKINKGARCISVVRAFAHGAKGHRIEPSWSGPVELFHVPASAPRLVLSCLWDGASKRTLAVNGFLSCYLNGPLPYV